MRGSQRGRSATKKAPLVLVLDILVLDVVAFQEEGEDVGRFLVPQITIDVT